MSVLGPPWLYDEPLKLLNWTSMRIRDFNADTDPAFHSNADPNPGLKNNAGSSGSGY